MLQSNQQIRKSTFVSKAVAFKRMQKLHPELTSDLPWNPLPDSFEIVPVKAEYIPDIAQSLRPPPPGVDRIIEGKRLSSRVLQVAHVIEIIFTLATIVLLIAATLLIANTIRLSIFSRRREIEVMKLVGATNWFVRGPFMLEGLICGLAGSLFAVVMLVLGKEIALPAILHHITDSSDAHALAFAWTALILLGFGVLLGGAGSGITIRRFLRV